MKKLLINAALLVLLAGSFSSCKKKIDEDYQNPELTTSGNIGKLFAGMFFNKRIHPSYWDYYTIIQSYTGAFSGIVPAVQSSTMYVTTSSYTDGKWTDFYNGSTGTDYNYNGPGILNNYREMQSTYNALSATDQAAQDIYMNLAKVIVADQAAQMVDLWGDIPFSKANSLNTSTRAIEYAAYDDAAALYDTLINNLDQVNTFLTTASVVATESGNLKLYDRIYSGDLTLWRRYANSLRLRLLMRISNVSEAKAQAAVTTMLNNPSTYPLITTNAQDALLWESPTNLVSDLLSAFTSFPYAPQYLLEDVLVANNDPRTKVMFDPDSTNGYKGFPYNGTSNDFSNGGYASYDSATFFYNYNLPGVLFTAAEASFLQAEAYERWGLGTAATAYTEGLDLSVEYFYMLNKKVSDRSTQYKWATQVVNTDTVALWKTASAVAYTGTTTEKLEKIYTQKWVNFFIMQANQAWAEYRRTGYPAIQLPVSNGIQANPPVRFLYPSNEALYNTANYSTVKSKDTRDTKIFWDVN
ncbi:SusD/RagB family nutrient-binding outer membrane lipoprotein [Chitinophaga sancti]|uniref:SusD/RagB family nutrient-binding outer membrane lipoprotein n=1 Tax=Chitinophaga sancti TaxID=1004 RepID=UPI002A749E95|nr:SusD/RagB family nutrient-binding outer membrane lipoprotein [Chitinophaga sancti]WPQ65347.1 SusD/RagB family nutrient-binding outer membrane lipoprotein [Chitinophaga sancti]